MAVTHDNCTPYLSATLFRVGNMGATLANIRTAIAELIESSGGPNSPRRQIHKPYPRGPADGNAHIVWFYYEEHRPPAWYSGDELSDMLHHVVILCQKLDILSMSFSDAAARNIVVKKIANAKNGVFLALSQLPSTDIGAAFIDPNVRTLWLSGAHRRSAVKPDAKVLSGLELESALDPLADQSYYFSSVRTASSNETLAVNGRAAVIGASPQHGRIWIGPTRSWSEFAGRIESILDQAASRTAGDLREEPPIPILARPTVGVGGVEQPYDVAIIVPELMLADGEANEGEERWLQQFSDAVRFDVIADAQKPNFKADVFWGDERLGALSFVFEERAGGQVRLHVEDVDWNEQLDEQANLLRICRNPEFLTIYFDTGHTFSRGHFYQTRFRDAQYNQWRWVDMQRDGTVVQQEKPLDGRRFSVESIGDANDKSLFGLVAKHWPNLEGRGHQRGWLVCDDGAMESADFIHFDDAVTPRRLTLIHVKGSHSNAANRGVSVADYEVVVGQAVKNLRHVDRENLALKLKANGSGTLKDAVWHDGVRQADRKGFLKALKAAGTNMERTVVVLQPRVQKKAYTSIRGKMDGKTKPDAEVRRMQQLDTLLLGARADCFGLGASFVVIGEDDT